MFDFPGSAVEFELRKELLRSVSCDALSQFFAGGIES